MKLPNGKTSAKFKVKLELHPFIDPKDGATAVSTLLESSSKSRRNITPDRLLEDLFIASLANKRPWTVEQLHQLEKCTTDRGFCERFARAMEEGRARIFDSVDVWMLCNWRVMRVPELSGKVPGLRDWSPGAACGLIDNITPVLHKDANEAWYNKRRQRLGLTGNPPYKVRQFFTRNGGMYADLRD